jgi:hypothetical protein
VAVGLRRNEALLNARQQPLPFGQRQTQVGNIANTIRPADFHYVETLGLAVDAGSNQTQNPFHPRSPPGINNRPIVSLSSPSPQSLDGPVSCSSAA